MNIEQFALYLERIGGLILKPVGVMGEALVNYTPLMLGALAVIIVGRIIAVLVRKALQKVFEATGFNSFSQQYELDGLLRFVGIRKTMGETVSIAMYWTIMLMFFTTAFEILGMQIVVDTLQDFIRFLPNIFLAAIVMVVSGLVSKLVRSAVTSSLANLDVTFGSALATLAQGVVLYFGAIVAAQKLNFNVDVVSQSGSYLIVGIIAIGVISIGLGIKTPASNIIASYYTKQLYKPGNKVILRGYEGTVKSVNNVAVTIETNSGELVIPNEEALKHGSLPQK